MRTKTFFIALILSISLILPYMVIANTDDDTASINELDEISDEALQMVKLHRYDEAQRILNYFSNQFVVATGGNQILTSDELRAVTASHNEAVQAAASINMNHEDRLQSVTKFRLVMDTVSTSNQPLWAEMKNPIMSVLGEVKGAAEMGDIDAFHQNFNSFLALYDIIYPSIKLDIDSERIQQLDTRIKYVDQYRTQVLEDEEDSMQELETLAADMEEIFEEITEDEADPSLWWVIISTGSIIILTLSYVGWRKYKGGKKKENNPES